MPFSPKRDPNTAVHLIDGLGAFRAASTIRAVSPGVVEQHWTIRNGSHPVEVMLASTHEANSNYRYTTTTNPEVATDKKSWTPTLNLDEDAQFAVPAERMASVAGAPGGHIKTTVTCESRSKFKNTWPTETRYQNWA